MKQIPFFLILVFCIFHTSILSAQLDNNSNNKKTEKTKVIVLDNSKSAKKPSSININSANGFKKAYSKEQEKLKKKQKEEEFNKKGILTAEQLNNLRTKEMYGKRTIEKVDSHQGDFLTKSKTVTISFRDFGAIDGDIIAIYHNNICIVKKTTLNQHYQSFQISLLNGNNKIEILALNQGSLGANTAQYKLINSEGLKIASQYWYLATGAKATFNVTKGE